MRPLNTIGQIQKAIYDLEARIVALESVKAEPAAPAAEAPAEAPRRRGRPAAAPVVETEDL